MEVVILVMSLWGQPEGTPVVTGRYPSAEACEAAAVRAQAVFRARGYAGRLVYVCEKRREPTPAELREQADS